VVWQPGHHEVVERSLLKESFADYCAGVCLTTLAQKFKKVIKNPEQAFLHFLTEAINEDILETTHPI